jgi:hypothetical protein
MKNLFKLTIAALIVVGTSVSLKAQTSNINATADVQQAISFNAVSNLAFGTVLPGNDKSITKETVGDAGSFDIDGTSSQAVTIGFTLPTQLTSANASATMPIQFSTTDAGWDGDGTPATLTAFDPSVSYGGASFDGTGNLFIFLGGTVQPTITQAAASDYTAVITLNISYQ